MTVVVAILCALCAFVMAFWGFILGAKRRSLAVLIMRVVQFMFYFRRLSRPNKDATVTTNWTNKKPLIWAHAGGADPIIYGNSKENYDKAIAHGYRCIEADVCITKDGVPVMMHGFRPNNENLYEGTPSIETFLKTKINDEYTPLTLQKFLREYRDFDGCFFLDGLRFDSKSRVDFREFFAEIPEYVRRKIIVQVFKFGDLYSLKKNNPFGGIHFSGVLGIGTNRYLRPLLIKVLKACGVGSVSISDWEITGRNISETIGEFNRNGIVVSVAGVNTLSQYKRLLKLGVTCIDSDYLTPNDLKSILG